MKDYWKMDESELARLAAQYNIEDIEYENETGHAFFNRSRVINSLVQRDSYRRTGWALFISILSIIMAFVALCSSLRRR